MKYITFAVPCYNSESYMEHCIETLLKGGEDVEIILVDDGSTDKTGKIADNYQKKYPNIIKAVHKENGGHGSGVNKGLELATGLYYKVVDSDDWVDGDALKKVLETIKKFHKEKKEIDYDKKRALFKRTGKGIQLSERENQLLEEMERQKAQAEEEYNRKQENRKGQGQLH